ncbi:MAG: molybdopterin-dependent oxidoreductase [Deltaproteobacteria bacterium]|nr:molybdopterin-dependent oxidoreductase [Deltaproteobacteria bacterium]
MSKKKIVRTVCQGCHSECGVLVHVNRGKVTRITPDLEHPASRGFICIKGSSYMYFTYHKERLKYPLKRVGKKGEGKWERISWDRALDEIAVKLGEIKEKYGIKSIGTFHGTAPRQSLFSCRLLAAALGTPNVANTDLHICHAPTMVAEIATIGCSVLQEKGPDYLNSKCIFVCGGNPLVSHPPRGRDLLEGVKKNGAKLIVVDPRRIKLAREADMWLQIRPGTDGALILGMLHTIISEGLYDRVFVEHYCYGFAKLVEHIKAYPPEKMAEITWLPPELIKKTARLFASIKPATVHHRVAVDQNINSTQTDRALAILAAITGNLGVKGGNLYPVHPSGYLHTGAVVEFSKLSPEINKERLGANIYPLISGPGALFTFVHAGVAANAMLHGEPYPLKGIYLAGANPVVNMQNTKRTWEAFKSLELLVVADFFMTPTAELADYVLPVTTWLERDECCDEQYMNCIAARQKAIEPLYESRDDILIVIDLVKRIPWANRRYLPWESVDEFNDFRVKGMGISFEDFKAKGYIPVDLSCKQEDKIFNTPTGKVEIYSTIFEKHGYAPLPIYTEPPESPFSTPELLKDYPYILITGGRTIEYYHSSGRQIEVLRKRMPDPIIEINPETALYEGINDNDWVWVETPRIKNERVKFKVRVTADIDPSVVHVQHGWWFPEVPSPDHGCFESNINVVLNDDPLREDICGSVPLRGTLCRIIKN